MTPANPAPDDLAAAMRWPAWPAAGTAQIVPSPDAGEVHLWWMDLATPPQPVADMAGWLDAGELERAARFRFEVHRHRFLAAHGQLRALLGAYLGVAPSSICFEHEERGKPRLSRTQAGNASELVFNLSHSDDQGLLAVARGTTLGADIEVQRPLRDLDALARSHFTSTELDELRSLPTQRHHDAFFAAWTRKEAYVKALGAGLSVPLDGFDVALHPDRPAALRRVGGSEHEARRWTLWAARPTPSSWAAVAVRTPGARVRTFSLRQIAMP